MLHTPNTPKTQKQSVLVVDDDQSITHIIRRTLEKNDFECQCAHSLQAAKAQIEARPFDVVLLDVNLPDGSGFTLPTLHKGDFKTPTIFLSGRTEAVDTVYALELGAEDYIKKPFVPAELLARIKSTLRRNAAGSEIPDQILPDRTARRISIGTLTFDIQAQRFEPEAREIAALADEERVLLNKLLTNTHRTVHKNELCGLLGWEPTMDNTRKLDSMVSRLKRVLFRVGASRNCIKYVYRQGYRINED